MTKEEVLDMAEKVYGECNWHDSALAHLEQFAKLVAEHEREACAKEAETTFYSIQAAENIRARGQE
jgi:hypothetical protein